MAGSESSQTSHFKLASHGESTSVATAGAALALSDSAAGGPSRHHPAAALRLAVRPGLSDAAAGGLRLFTGIDSESPQPPLTRIRRAGPPAGAGTTSTQMMRAAATVTAWPLSSDDLPLESSHPG